MVWEIQFFDSLPLVDFWEMQNLSRYKVHVVHRIDDYFVVIYGKV